MSRLFGLAVAAAIAVGLGACQTVYNAWDRAFGTRPAQKPAELVSIQPKAALKVLWQGSVGAAEKSVYFPATDGGLVYAVGASGGVSGFEAAGGATVVRFEAGQGVSGGVGAHRGLVLLGTPRGEVLAFDRNGKPLWKAQLSGEVLAPPQMQENTVVARAGGGQIHGLDAASGKQKWVYQRTTPPLSLRTHAGVAVERGAVFVGFPGGRLVGIALADGKVGWEAVVALPRGTTELERVADISSLPLIDGSRVCAVAYQGRLGCYDAARGSLLWARDVSSVAGLAADDRYIYVSDDKNAVLAFDKSSGASIWRQDKLAGRNVTAPLAIGRYVVVGDLEGYVHLIAREDGSFAARIATDGSAIGAPPLALDVSSFVVQTRNGGVFAIAIQ
jgi:outer membrane protein assembly factor BamB